MKTHLFQFQTISLCLDFLMLVPHSPLYKEWWNLLFPHSGWKNKLHRQKKREPNKTTLWVNELELDLTMEHFGFNLAQSKYWGCTGSLYPCYFIHANPSWEILHISPISRSAVSASSWYYPAEKKGRFTPLSWHRGVHVHHNEYQHIEQSHEAYIRLRFQAK